MKKFVTLLITSAFATSFLLAQATHTPPSPATMAQQRVNRLTKMLTLNTTQQGQALTIFTTQFTADATTHASLKTLRQSLATGVQTDNTGEIASLSTQIGSLEGALVQSEATANAQFYQILTSTQQTQFNNLRQMGMGGPDMGGMRGFGRRGN
jgi:Spy/CpxP family protein refolding chaperone